MEKRDWSSVFVEEGCFREVTMLVMGLPRVGEGSEEKVPQRMGIGRESKGIIIWGHRKREERLIGLSSQSTCAV